MVHSIYRTFCKIGDKEPIQRDELLWMIVLSFQRRAKTKDNVTKHMPRNTGIGALQAKTNSTTQ